MMQADRQKPIRRGVTLVELLVVVSIMTLLAAIALPAMQTGMESRRTREAARAIHVFFGSARVRAIENGRPVGVMIERSDEYPEAGVLLRQVEIPPPYAGDFEGAAIRVQNWTVNPLTGMAFMPGFHVLRAAVRYNFEITNGLIRAGNKIQLSHQGPLYEIVSESTYPLPQDFDEDVKFYIDFQAPNQANNPLADNDADGWVDTHVLTLILPYTEVPNLPWPIVTAANTPSYPTPNPTSAGPTPGGLFTGQWSAALPFQITRNPVPSSVAPLSLPRGMVVDLGDSGTDIQLFPTTTSLATGPVILFSPNGQIERIWAGNVDLDIFPIFLMIGRRERVGSLVPPTVPPLLAEDGLENWQDAENLWLVLNPRSGQVTVSEVSAEQAPGVGNNPSPNAYVPNSKFTSRAFARQAQVSMGGR